MKTLNNYFLVSEIRMSHGSIIVEEKASNTYKVEAIPFEEGEIKVGDTIIAQASEIAGHLFVERKNIFAVM